MRKALHSVFSFLILTAFIQAQDTVTITAHQGTVMKWYEGYNQMVEFPEEGTSFQKINMNLTLGCPASGCSDWDYTVLIFALIPTGEIDTSIQSIDTISTDPVVLDTTYRYRAIKERFELGRMITPYAGYMARGTNGFDNSWEHPYTFDVTDYRSLLTDSTELQVFYQGWSSGFTADIEFEFIEGVPPRNVVHIENIYRPGGYNYIQADSFEKNVLPKMDVPVKGGTSHVALHFLPTGHGFINSLNCAEFCQRSYYVSAQDVTFIDQLMWRFDCGVNPIYPQGGTWLYDRANWCPGSKAIRYEHDLTPAILNDTIPGFDIDIERYEYTVPAGEVPANYNISAVLIHHEGYNFDHNAALTDIIKPSTDIRHARQNPSCGEAIIEIQNLGGVAMESAEIKYGFEGGAEQSFTWNGFLAPMEKEEVYMPMPVMGQRMESQRFYAVIESVNGNADEQTDNNRLETQAEVMDHFEQALTLEFKTNFRPNESWWRLSDEAGNVVYEERNMASNQRNEFMLDLATGCYHLEIVDTDEDGLAFFANNDGSGYVRLESSNGIPLKRFSGDFGSRIDYYFTYRDPNRTKQEKKAVFVYPNPAQDQLFISTQEVFDAPPSLMTTSGLEVKASAHFQSQQWVLQVGDVLPGMYLLKYTIGGEVVYKKVVIQ